MKESYRLTITAKILVCQMLIFFIGTVYGLSCRLYTKEWYDLTYSTKVSALRLTERNSTEDEGFDYVSENLKAIEKGESDKVGINDTSDQNRENNPDTYGYETGTNELSLNNSDEAKADDSSINAVISSFATDFSSSSYERINNIELSTNLINGKLLMPGEIFSFNDCVGERTEDRGFMTAPIIVGDKIDSGVGGGVCQVSTTLYNAVLMAGLAPIEITHHTLPSSYVDLGLDATVNWDNIDFKFQNMFDYPICLEAYTQDCNLYINIYSNSSLLSRKYVVTSNVYETIYPATKTIEDPSLPKGQTLSIKEARNGYKVRVIRDIYENESLVASEIISDQEYMPVSGIIGIGGK